MDGPDFKIKGLGQENNKKGDDDKADSLKNENQLNSSNSPGSRFKENTDSGEVDPDKVMKNFQNKFESDDLAIDLNENKDNYHVKFELDPISC